MSYNYEGIKHVYCLRCKEKTKSIEPVIIRRYNTFHFNLIVLCDKCKQLKSTLIDDSNRSKLPDYFFYLPFNAYYMNYIYEKSGIKHEIINDIFCHK